MRVLAFERELDPADYPSPLALYLARRGMTQRELMRLTGLPIQTVSAAYHGRPGQLETYLKIRRALGCPLAEIAPQHAAALKDLQLF
jgi:transcriptional regulator with XRE-family HTH domain